MAYAMVAIGVVVMLANVPLSFAWREWSLAALAALVIASIVGVWILRRGLPWNVLDMSVIQSRRVWRVLAVDMAFHVLAVSEAYLTLQWLLGSLAPTFTEALLFEVLNRVVTVAFKFVPLRVGIDEAASGAFAPLLSVSSTAGVALAVIRKVRNLFWMGIGLTLIGVHHAQGAPATDRRETVPAHRP